MNDNDIEDEPLDEIRTPYEVARRTLALFRTVAVAFGADRAEMKAWLDRHSLTAELTHAEIKFLDNSAPSKREVIEASWYSERLIVLLWALNLAPMPAVGELCDTSVFARVLPPCAAVGADEFIATAKLRTEEELHEMAERIWSAHWKARDATLHGREPPDGIDLGIIQERHHAINWLNGYMGESWDEVTTDT